MELTFSKINGGYVATFDATTSFNLHIEKNGGNLSVALRTSQTGGYAPVKDVIEYAYDNTIDIDFMGGIFPKSVQIMCGTMPTKAIVTFAE